MFSTYQLSWFPLTLTEKISKCPCFVCNICFQSNISSMIRNETQLISVYNFSCGNTNMNTNTNHNKYCWNKTKIALPMLVLCISGLGFQACSMIIEYIISCQSSFVSVMTIPWVRHFLYEYKFLFAPIVYSVRWGYLQGTGRRLCKRVRSKS